MLFGTTGPLVADSNISLDHKNKIILEIIVLSRKKHMLVGSCRFKTAKLASDLPRMKSWNDYTNRPTSWFFSGTCRIWFTWAIKDIFHFKQRHLYNQPQLCLCSNQELGFRLYYLTNRVFNLMQNNWNDRKKFFFLKILSVKLRDEVLKLQHIIRTGYNGITEGMKTSLSI